MSRYVDVEKIQHLIVETGDKHSRNGEDIQTCGSICADLIINVYELPTANVVEVQHGHWEKVDDNPYEYVAACSVCHNEVKQPTCMLKPIYSYCPICGAKMINNTKE